MPGILTKALIKNSKPNSRRPWDNGSGGTSTQMDEEGGLKVGFKVVSFFLFR